MAEVRLAKGVEQERGSFQTRSDRGTAGRSFKSFARFLTRCGDIRGKNRKKKCFVDR